MNTDEKIMWAEEIAEKLKSNKEFVITEFNKWCKHAEKDLRLALKFAERMKDSNSLRNKPKDTYDRIFKTFQAEFQKLETLSKKELSEVLGYVKRWLVAKSTYKKRGKR